MKKLLSLVLALVLCLSCFVAAQAATEADFVGSWELESMTMMGVLTLSRDELDYTVDVTIYEDERMLLAMDENFAIAKVVYADGQAYMTAGEDQMPLAIDEEGKLNVTMTVEEISMDLKMVRCTEAAAVDAAFAPYIGEWNLDHVSLLGLTMTAEQMGQIDLIVYENGYGVIIMDGELMSFKLVNEAGVVNMLDSEAIMYPLTISEQGQLSFALEAEGITMELVMNPAVAAPVVEAVVEPATETEVVPAGAFDGNWVGTSVSLMGLSFTMEEMEMSVSLNITGNTAVMDFDGESAPCTVTVDGNTCLINDGVTDAPCTLNENGQLCMTLEVEGLSMTLIMERQ